MFDISLALAFLHELHKEMHILWVGDTDQHSLFGEGNVLHDYILLPCYIHITLVKSKAVPLWTLHTTFWREMYVGYTEPFIQTTKTVRRRFSLYSHWKTLLGMPIQMVSCSSLLRFTNFSPYTLRSILNQSNISTILRDITTEDYRSANKHFL